jgi:hypothetical protein
LIWLGNGGGGDNDTSTTSTHQHYGAVMTDTSFIGLITTLQTSPSSSSDPNQNRTTSTATTTTFLTVIDRTCGIPIYTMQCGSWDTNDNNDTLSPILIHDATPNAVITRTTTTTTTTKSGRGHPRHSESGSNSSAT